VTEHTNESPLTADTTSLTSADDLNFEIELESAETSFSFGEPRPTFR
jgi:hypothetical protein